MRNNDQQAYAAFEFVSRRNNKVVVYNVRQVVQSADQWARRAKWVSAYAVVNNSVWVPVPAAYMAPAVVHAANF